MAKSTGIIIAVGAITFANRSILHDNDIDWRIPIGTGFAAMAFSIMERGAPKLVTGIAWIALITVLLARTDPRVPSPVETLYKIWNKGG